MTPSSENFEEIQRDRVLLTGLTHLCPQICCVTKRAPQVTKNTFSISIILEFNYRIRITKNVNQINFQFKKWNGKRLHLRVYSN